MKFCIRNRQNATLLSKADEIKMEYRDYKSIPNLINDYPNTPLIIQIQFTDIVDWENLSLYKDYIICAVASRAQAQICKDLNIKFYYGYPIGTYYELNNWLKAGVCYVRLDAPIFFELPQVIKLTKDIPIRAVPNIAYEFPCEENDGINGTWIRPEDVKLYENYISIFEFEDCDNQKEQALYRIYAEERNWPGEIKTLISNFKPEEPLNRLLPPDFAERRLNCAQKCELGKCNHC